jgi:hypothetical protein
MLCPNEETEKDRARRRMGSIPPSIFAGHGMPCHAPTKPANVGIVAVFLQKNVPV